MKEKGTGFICEELKCGARDSERAAKPAKNQIYVTQILESTCFFTGLFVCTSE